MGISNRHLNTHEGDIAFNLEALAEKIRLNVPGVSFCLLMGSAVNGVVKEGSDIDLACYLDEPASLDFYAVMADAVGKVLPSVRCDIGILNRAEPVYRFEALKGRLLFVRDMETYAEFFSRTCREYESQMFDYERQKRYRMEAKHAV